jgi:hypothetical protein
MVNNQYESNNDNKNTVVEYNTFCDARGCNKIATNRLKIFYLKIHCWFCNDHKQYFQQKGLVESVFKEGAMMGGENSFGEV